MESDLPFPTEMSGLSVCENKNCVCSNALAIKVYVATHSGGKQGPFT